MEMEFFGGEKGVKCVEDLKFCVIEYNMFVIVVYYLCMFFSRFFEFLCLSFEETEKYFFLCVVDKFVVVKIDCLVGFVNFFVVKFSDFLFNKWVFNIDFLFTCFDKASYLI